MNAISEKKLVKSGFAVILGRSNVGKSTLLNTLVGTKIAAVTTKAQTTRHIIHGVVNDDRGQIVFVDTPGVLKEKNSPLTPRLLERVKNSLQDIDCVVYVVDPTREIGEEERYTLSLIRKTDVPKILVINKTDIHKKPFIDDYRFLMEDEGFDQLIELSALRGRHIQPLKEAVMDALPEIPEDELPYPDGQLTNMNEKFWIEEIIREKIFIVTRQEVPYSTTVEIDTIEDKPEKQVLVISGRIVTTADRYKKMLIGHRGQKIKEIGLISRKELEQATNKKIFLELTVEVNPKWELRM